jgi:hypothetical protein
MTRSRGRLVVSSAFLILGLALAPAQASLGDALGPALSQLAAGVSGRPVVAFGTFTYADKNVGSAFSRYLEEALSVGIASQGRMEVFARDRLDEVLAAQELSLSDLADRTTAPSIGNIKGVQALLSGSFFDAGEEIEVHLQLVSVESGTLFGKAAVSVPKRTIPAAVSILPDNYNDALYVLEQLASLQGTGGAFKVKAWSPRGDGGTYRDGEKLVVSFYSNRDSFIKIYHVDVQKTAKLIFPNQYHRSNAVVAGRIYRIPDASYPFTFELGAPYGTEFVKVVASTTQFSDIEEAFADMGLVTSAKVARGLTVTGKDAQVAEASFSYTILR